jgi:hypothetical protein
MVASFFDLVDRPSTDFAADSSNITGSTHSLAYRQGQIYFIFIPCDLWTDLAHVRN